MPLPYLELKAIFEEIAQGETTNLIPSDTPLFQQKVIKAVSDRLKRNPQNNSLVIYEETLGRLLPVVYFLTQSRCIEEFQYLKGALLSLIWRYHPKLYFERQEKPENENQKGMSELMEWITYILPVIRFFPAVELDNLLSGEMDPDQIWKKFEVMDTKKLANTDEKIVPLEQAINHAKQIFKARDQGSGSGRVGLVVGKWRFIHQGHIALFETAKQALGKNGLLIVGVESQGSIWQRRGKEHFTFPDEDRLKQVAALEAVDEVVLLNPTGPELNNLDGFYAQVWRSLNPDIYFFGNSGYHWRSPFEKRADQMGILLLWLGQMIERSAENVFRLMKENLGKS